RLYVTDYNDWYAYVWDIASRSVVNYHYSPTPEGMAIDTVSKRIYITSYDSDQIVEVDATTDGSIQYLNVGSGTSQVGVLRGGRKVFFNTYSAAGASDVKLLKY
ncbi:MAG TPA: hypothetical protein VEK77_10275, partial [Gemmatimonadales bacterium]|nr:hypothetical protein [Gemmatimonadales bacterium]